MLPTHMFDADVLGSDRILQLLVGPLQSLGQAGSEFDWRTAEAALYCIKCASIRVLQA